MNNVYVIVTYNEKYKEPEYNLESAAEAWKECGVCAIGWSRSGNLKKVRENKLNKDMQLFLQIEKGDLILAYTGNNTIAYMGEIKDGKLYPVEGKVRGLAQLIMKKTNGISEGNLVLLFVGVEIVLAVIVLVVYL